MKESQAIICLAISPPLKTAYRIRGWSFIRIEPHIAHGSEFPLALTLYAHPFSSYCQKVLMALWQNETEFTYRHLEDEGAMAALSALWPIKKFPVLVDGDKAIIETSIIIEYLDTHYLGKTRLLPKDQDLALEVRFLDRFFDQYIMNEMNRCVFEAIKTDGGRAEAVRNSVSENLETAYGFLEKRLKDRTWAAGDDISMADCAAAPSLFYADWVHQIGPHWPILRAYRTRLLAQPAFARCVEEGRKYRHYFPLGAPDRD